MRIWGEVSEADGEVLGLVNLVSVTVTRRLDAAGEIRLDVPSSDRQAAKYMRLGRYVQVYVKRSERDERELIETGVLLHDTINVGQGGSLLTSWQATDGFEDFRRDNTMRGRVYNNRPIVDVINDLLPAGWNATFDMVEGNTSQRFDGLSLFKAVDRVRDWHGYHFRLGSGSKRMQFGTFGKDSGVRVTNAAVADPALWSNRELILIQKLTIVEDGYDIINWVEPISGPADAPLTLRKSTRIAPYPIQETVGPDGKTIYFCTDNASIARYGTIKAVLAPRSLIVPVEASAGALLNASNVLYDWMAATLSRRSVPQVTYSIAGIKADTVVRPGDKIHVTYKGEAVQKGRAVKYVDVDTDLWVLAVTETYGLGGQQVGWEVSTVDVQPASAVDMVADVIQGQRQAATSVSIQVDRQEFEEALGVSSGSPQSMVFSVRDSSISVPSCLVTVTRSSEDGPGTVDFTLDGETVEGGPFLYSPGQLTASVEIEALLNESATIQGEHTLGVSVLFDGDGSDLDVKVSLVEATLGAASVG